MKLRIKEYREELGLTQGELAQKLGNAQRNVSNWENGHSEPDCASIVKLTQVFDISLDELFFGEKITPNTLASVDNSIIKILRNLSEPQKYALLHFLKEITQ